MSPCVVCPGSGLCHPWMSQRRCKTQCGVAAEHVLWSGAVAVEQTITVS